MNNEIKQRWLAALRSGEYQQAQGNLRRDNGFCCLGVLCDLYGKEKELGWTGDEAEGFFFLGHGGDLPNSVIQWANVPDRNPDVMFFGKRDCLAGLNDNGCTFMELADIIEEQL